MKLSIIIVSYNVKYYLEQCLLSVRRAIEGIDAEVIVIDNNSQDGSVDYLSKRFPDVIFLKSDQNLGFARANNKVIKHSRGEYVLLLNPDTVVGEDVLRESLRFMETHPKAGGAGVRMLKTNGADAKESRRGIPTPMTSFYKMIGLCSRFPKNKVFGKYYMGYLPWNIPSQIEIVSGAYFM
ncbi:glycosyltransferase family 2 protein, partial [Hallella bergensis]|uniref:glycosyltransferase family 2 protein n=1 Tax=Hallella bergensis TaxID=242750 RepID=UPI003990520E